MPNGCDLLCQNADCECYDKRISLHGAWPIGKIGDVMKASVYKDNQEAQEAFQRRVAAGIEYACISIPNSDGIKPKGKRIQLYCKGCKEIQSQDMLAKAYGKGKELNRVVDKEVVSPSPCSKCGGERASCETEKVPCPKCGRDMKRIGWFTKGV
jgi:hypothetical protein